MAPSPAPPARGAPAAFPKGHPSLALREPLGTIVQDEDLAALFPAWGSPGLPPGRVAVVTLRPLREPLADRQAAAAVRARSAWQDLWGRALPAPGVALAGLRALRARLRAGSAGALLRDQRLARGRTRGLSKTRGPHRTDATPVLAAIRGLKRRAVGAATRRVALNARHGRPRLVAGRGAPCGVRTLWHAERGDALAARPGPPRGLRPDGGRGWGGLPRRPRRVRGPRGRPRPRAPRCATRGRAIRPARRGRALGSPPLRAACASRSPGPYHATQVHTTAAAGHAANGPAGLQQALVAQALAPTAPRVAGAYSDAERLLTSPQAPGLRRRGPTRPLHGGQTPVAGASTVEPVPVAGQPQTGVWPQGPHRAPLARGGRKAVVSGGRPKRRTRRARRPEPGSAVPQARRAINAARESPAPWPRGAAPVAGGAPALGAWAKPTARPGPPRPRSIALGWSPGWRRGPGPRPGPRAWRPWRRCTPCPRRPQRAEQRTQAE